MPDPALFQVATHPPSGGLPLNRDASRRYGGQLTGRQKRGHALDDLSGKVAVVSGGAAGIGRGITEAPGQLPPAALS